MFLDELPEFNRRTLEVLRQPLEENRVTISRAMGSLTFPANLMLVAAMNPCPCGYRGDPRRQCNCTPMQIERYLSRISGPLLDRIDIHVEVPPVPFRNWRTRAAARRAPEMGEQVVAARDRQIQRFQGRRRKPTARWPRPKSASTAAWPATPSRSSKTAMEELGLSARGHDKILRVGRTIADLAGATDIAAEHLSEAINYRTLDRRYWA